MQVDYVGCSPLDALGTVPHALYRLSFVPQVPILPDSFFAADWEQAMADQLDRIGRTPYLYAAQGQPTIVDDRTHGKAGVIDCAFRNDQASAAVQVAAQAVEDSFGYAKLSRVERINSLTVAKAEARPVEQQKTAEGEAAKEAASTPGAVIKKYAGWALFAVVVAVVGVIVWKAPKLGT